jgi:hypothetical protein
MLVASTNVFSQTDDPEKGTPEFRAQKLTEWMKNNLVLTPEQEQQVAPINLDCAVKIDSIRNLQLTKMDRFKKLKEVQKYRESQFEKILDAGQMQKFREERKEMANKRRSK